MSTTIPRPPATWPRPCARKPSRVFPLRAGRWHDVPVGPHTQAMYQLLFDPGVFASLVPWLMLNRRGLDVLVHPDTGLPAAITWSTDSGWAGCCR